MSRGLRIRSSWGVFCRVGSCLWVSSYYGEGEKLFGSGRDILRLECKNIREIGGVGRGGVACGRYGAVAEGWKGLDGDEKSAEEAE